MRRRPGRPGVMREISDLIVRMALENLRWGYTRIQGALSNLQHTVGRSTVANVLKANGIQPAPERGKVWTDRGLVTHYVLFVVGLADRFVEVLGVTTTPGEAWMMQVGRNLIDSEGGALRGKRYLIIDRDAKYTDQFRRLLQEAGYEVIRLPPMSPNLNAYAERFVTLD
jgi:putative transposase